MKTRRKRNALEKAKGVLGPTEAFSLVRRGLVSVEWGVEGHQTR